jgi:hypothetical protein
MPYIVIVDHSSMAVHLTRSDCEGFVCAVQWMGLMVICCGMAVKGMGMLGMSVREMRALTVKMETVTLSGKGGRNLTCLLR